MEGLYMCAEGLHRRSSSTFAMFEKIFKLGMFQNVPVDGARRVVDGSR